MTKTIEPIEGFILTEPKENLGLLGPDPEDTRDIALETAVPYMKEDYPEIMDFDTWTIISRQFYGTCTSHAASGTDEHQESEEERKQINLASKFTYITTKLISGRYDMEGDYLRNAMKSLEKYGVPLEKDFPDLPNKNWTEYVRTKIATDVFEKARIRKIKGYATVGRSLNDVFRGMWTTKSPVATGMEWFKGYRGIQPNGYLPPASGDSVGGHAIRIVKADFKEEKVWFANSWGTNWGNKGYFYIPFSEWDKHNRWNHWVISPLDNSSVKSMYKLITLDRKDIYAVKNGVRHLIINKYTFEKGRDDEQWGDWSQVVPITKDEFDNLKEGDVFIRVQNQ